MTRTKIMICLATLAFSATGCTVETNSEISQARLRRIDAQHLAVRGPGGPEAVLSAAGEISIDGKHLSLDQTQKDLAARYYATASLLREDGFTTGMAGASTAMTAITSVFTGLASGDPDKIGPAIEAKAAKVEAGAEKICVDLRELAATQNALAASLPEFKAYALIGAKDVDKCRG